jgi:hypothetical protein
MGTRSAAWGVALLVAPLVAASGCGYRVPEPVQGAGGAPLAIEVRMFENRSAEPGLEALLAAALAEEMLRRGQVRPLYGGPSGAADLVLDGEIRSATVRPASFSSVGLALEYEMQVGLVVEVRRSGGGELVWRQPALRERERYLASSNAGVERSNREQAMRRIAAAVAGRIHDELAQSR